MLITGHRQKDKCVFHASYCFFLIHKEWLRRDPHIWSISTIVLTTINSCRSSIPSLSMSARSHILPSVSTGNFESINTPFTWKYKGHHITKMHQATKYYVTNFSHNIFHVIHKLLLLVYMCEHTHTHKLLSPYFVYTPWQRPWKIHLCWEIFLHYVWCMTLCKTPTFKIIKNNSKHIIQQENHHKQTWSAVLLTLKKSLLPHNHGSKTL